MVTAAHTCIDFAERHLHLDCSKITFERVGEQPFSFAGPGRLSGDEDGGIRLDVHLDERNFDAARAAIMPIRIGEVLSDTRLFRVSVLTYDGVCWLGKAWPSLSNLLATDGMITGRVNELEWTDSGSIPKQNMAEWVVMYLPYIFLKFDSLGSKPQPLVLTNTVSQASNRLPNNL